MTKTFRLSILLCSALGLTYISFGQTVEMALQAKKRLQASSLHHFDLDSPQITTSDIDNFWYAFDQLAVREDSVRVFQELYIDKASSEFKKFLKLRNFTAEEYVRSVRKLPKFWNSVRPMTEQIKYRKKELIPFFKKMEAVYPEYEQPDVCFAIGTLRTGGTTTQGLILVGAEIAAADSTIDKSELEEDNFMRMVLGSTGDIIAMVAHEAVHTQQPTGDNENASLLKQAIIEGGADFIASLLLAQQTMNKVTLDYGLKHEETLWKEFYKDVKEERSFDDTDWFYDYRSNRPADLGYFIGFKICEFYYNQSADKGQALEDIIEMTDPVEFLEKSRYREKFK